MASLEISTLRFYLIVLLVPVWWLTSFSARSSQVETSVMDGMGNSLSLHPLLSPQMMGQLWNSVKDCPRLSERLIST
ncbi:hypothetical protein NPIL_64091 [Nephila pilipes]|uniref:Uncharacterized protein n=1 Tax=Nephila pilipes TaxID=299642 RepID=A0A8X6JSN3_NEPPI|nr:hypothetical protein NPIL_64091 [Nephila pilipes]